jgi:protein-S-isoprenylcysteine O-methyltransferase Ste14
MNKCSLLIRSITGLIFLLGILGILLFTVSKTFTFWQAWVYLIIFGVSSSLVTIYLWKKDPSLLERRVKAGPTAEKSLYQKIVQFFASFVFIGIFVIAALDHNFSWSHISIYLTIAGDTLVIIGFYIIFLVFKENTYTSATIEVASNQKVIATGPYAIVRHPMYYGAFMLLLGTPLALGSLWTFISIIILIYVIVLRLLDEETFLIKNLKGYKKYCQKVRYRLVPHVW